MIGYYAHNHGSGHCNYANLLSRTFKDSMVVFTSKNYEFYKDTNVVFLPDEDYDGTELNPEQFPEPCYLHYAPLHLKKIQIRNYALLKETIAEGVKLLIVDVSVEIAALARVCSIPYAYVRMFGKRDDTPHIGAYEGAAFLIAYYPEELEPTDTPEWIKKKTLYCGFYSRYSHSSLTWQKALTTLNLTPDEKIITCLLGCGENDASLSSIADLAAEFPDHKIFVLGENSSSTHYPNVQYKGFVKDPSLYLKVSEFAVGPCGITSIAEIADLDVNYIAIPENRPFDEQLSLAKTLEEKRLISIKKENESFSTCLNRLLKCKNEWPSLTNPNAPIQLLDWLQAYNYELEYLCGSLEQSNTLSQHIQNILNQKPLAG
jgi:hypothetical protein